MECALEPSDFIVCLHFSALKKYNLKKKFPRMDWNLNSLNAYEPCKEKALNQMKWLCILKLLALLKYGHLCFRMLRNIKFIQI